jgi:DNA-binding NarL/FixJ family response regulator
MQAARMMVMIENLLLVDRHAAMRHPLALHLARALPAKRVLEAGSNAEAAALSPGIDVAVTELDLPDGDAAALISLIAVSQPAAKIVVLTGSEDLLHAAQAVEAGAHALVHKRASVEDLIETIHRLTRGERLLTETDIAEMRRAARQNRPGLNPATGQHIRLTDRENDVLQALAAGLSDKQIARELGVSVETVRTHVKGIFNKLGAGSRLQALALAVRYGLVYFR